MKLRRTSKRSTVIPLSSSRDRGRRAIVSKEIKIPVAIRTDPAGSSRWRSRCRKDVGQSQSIEVDESHPKANAATICTPSCSARRPGPSIPPRPSGCPTRSPRTCVTGPRSCCQICMPLVRRAAKTCVDVSARPNGCSASAPTLGGQDCRSSGVRCRKPWAGCERCSGRQVLLADGGNRRRSARLAG